MAAAVYAKRHVWVAVLAGMAWAQGAIALQLRVLPHYLVLGERIADGGLYRLASWTLLAPATLASHCTSASPSGVVAQPSLVGIALCPVFAVGLCLSVLRVLGSPRCHRYCLFGLAVAGLLGVTSGAAVAWQFIDAAHAERTFFAMVSRVDTPHTDPATVSAARTFVKRYPDSRWAGEALRIIAMAEWDEGDYQASSELWRRFASGFRDPTAPGVAYAEYSIALCDERLGRGDSAEGHLRAAVQTIRVRSDGIQAWIATDAAERLSVLERLQGRYAVAGYWKAKSGTFADVYSAE